MIQKLKVYVSVGLLFCVATTVRSDDFASDAVAKFITNSLNNWVAESDTLEINETVTLGTPLNPGLFSMEGSLRNIQIEGLSRTKSILVDVDSIVVERKGSFEYNFDMDNINITGDYNLNGSVGSSIYLSNEGRFKVQFLEAVNFYCNSLLASEDGYLKAESCSNSNVDIHNKEAQIDFVGLAESANSTRLDALLIADVYNRILQLFNYRGLRTLILKVMGVSSMNHIQRNLDSTQLVEIITATKPSSKSNPTTNQKADTEVSSALTNRVETFVNKCLEEFATVHVDPVSFNGTFMLDKQRSVLFPINATFTNIKYSGLARMSNIRSYLTEGYDGVSLEIAFNMTNLQFNENYVMDGELADEIPINKIGVVEYLIFGDCKVTLRSNWENPNGNLILLRNPFSFLECPMKQNNVTFSPSPLDGTGVDEPLENLIIEFVANSIAYSVVNGLGGPIGAFVLQYLQIEFQLVPVVEIITVNARL